MVHEKWKEIAGSKSAYKISSFGRVWSIRYNREVKPTNTRLGYPVITISTMEKRQQFMHRLMAISFLPNPKKHKIVNHIDGNRTNYSLSNLEWCTQSHNVKTEYESGRRVGKTNMRGKFGALHPCHKKIKQFDKTGKFLRVISGVGEAAKTVNGSASHITKVCRGKLNHHKGYKWKYA